jgi:hypothetical protein
MRTFFAIKIKEIRMTNVDLSWGYQTKSVEIPVPVKCWIRLARSKMGRKKTNKQVKNNPQVRIQNCLRLGIINMKTTG